MAYDERLTVDPGKRGGKVCIRGTRVTVIEVLESLGSGMTQEQTLANFPDLQAADIQACLEYAADRERKMVKIPRESNAACRSESCTAAATGGAGRRIVDVGAVSPACRASRMRVFSTAERMGRP